MTKRAWLSSVLLIAACGGNSPAPVKPAPAPQTAVVASPPAQPAPSAAQQWLVECQQPLADAAREIEKLEAVDGTRTQDNTLEPFNDVMRLIGNATDDAGLYAEVHPDPAVRDAARTCSEQASKLAATLMLDRTAYDALRAVDVSKADADTRRFVAMTLRDYKRGGVDLDDSKRARLKAITEEMTALGNEFGKNIAEDTRYIEIKDPARLAGLPADYIAAHKPDAAGTIKISTDYPDYTPFMTYAADDDLRKQLYIQFQSRAAAHNEEILGKVLVLRAEQAKLLGFADWADYISDDKMLRGGKAEQEFIDHLAAITAARVKRDYAEMLAQLRKHDPKATAVAGWQTAWLSSEIKKAKYDVDDSVVRQYLVYDNVLAGLLEITSKIYDIKYVPVPDAARWHPDVVVYDVMRKDQHLGRIFLDMHPRDGKYKHAAEFPIQDGIEGVQIPEAALVCNLPDPKTSSGPALMSQGDVIVMFHEFGHLMHHVLGGHHHWTRQAGTSVEQDFVEAPSQMFEEWGKSYETLSRFAKHYETGKPIPKELVAKMRRAESFGRGQLTAQQLFYAALSLAIHRADPATLDQDALVKQLQAKYTPFAFVDGTHFHASFGHLIEYSSMYYTYQWSLVIAKDMQTAFSHGLMDTATTYKYRDAILRAGGTKDAAELVKNFLGRPYSFKAYEQYLAQ